MEQLSLSSQPQECRRMKEAGRVEQGVSRQDRTNGEDGTKRVWKPALVDLPDLKC